MAVLQFATARQESATFDEGVHLAAGYRYWRTGNYSLNVEHPPLQKLLSAAPLLWVNPPMPADPKLLTDQSEYARVFLYGGAADADWLVLLGRLPTLFLSSLLLAAVYWAGRKHFGAPVAVAAVWLCAMDPNLIAHGRYITTDMASALLYFLAVAVWINYLLSPSWRRAAVAALVLGLALSAKFSMVVLLLLLPLIALLHWVMGRGSWRPLAVLPFLGAGAVLVVLVTYAPESWRLVRGRNVAVEAETIRGYELPPHRYLTGLRTVIDHNSEGHPSYLLGETRESGWWYYFPVVFLVKSPTALLLLVLLGAGAGLVRIHRAEFLWLGLLLPPLVYFATTLTSHINLGVRHLLPMYPFLYLLCAAAILCLWPGRRGLLIVGGLAALQTGETLVNFPEYLGYFNLPAGGRAAGPGYLLDSNVDWGQDLKKLKSYIDTNGSPKVCLDYFGSVEPKYYGIQFEYLPKSWDKDELERMDCIGAISETLLQDLYIRPGSYEWLRGRPAMGTVGSSIRLYDLRKPGAR